MGKQNRKAVKREAELERLKFEIKTCVEKWKYIRDNGCSDPFLSDGANMNLVRNHIAYYRGELRALCTEAGWDLPCEAFVADPPEVDKNYFARPDSERAIRIRNFHGGTTIDAKTPVPGYDEMMLTLF